MGCCQPIPADRIISGYVQFNLHLSHFNFDSEDDNHTGCRNVSHCQQQSFSGLHSPGQSCSTYLWINAEAYNLDASNFPLFVQNYAEVFQLSNQKHRLFCYPNMVLNSSPSTSTTQQYKLRHLKLLYNIINKQKHLYLQAVEPDERVVICAR